MNSSFQPTLSPDLGPGIEIEPDAFRWARERRGLDFDAAAKQLGLDEIRLQQLENGTLWPSSAQLRKASLVYQVPAASFFVSNRSRSDFEPPNDFRTLPDNTRQPFSPELREQIERVRAQVRNLERLSDPASQPPTEFEIRLRKGMPVEQAASSVRSWLGIPTRVVASSKSDRRRSPFQTWVGRMETHGIYVTQVSGVKVDEMRGFCLPNDRFPMLVLNGADSVSGRLFTLVHELIHLLSEQSSVCNDHHSNDATERHCNRVAAAALMPEPEIRSDWITYSLRAREIGDLAALRFVAKPYGVSREALMRRFHTFDLVTADSYREVRAALVQEYARRSSKKPSGGPDREDLIVRNLGRKYVASVVSARRSGEISDFEAARFLFAKTRWLDPVQQVLEKM